jgi:hypothetical protein
MFFKKKILLLFSLYPYPISGPCLPWPSTGQVLCRPLHSLAQCAAAPPPIPAQLRRQPAYAPRPSTPLPPPFSPLERRGPASVSGPANRARAAALFHRRTGPARQFLPPVAGRTRDRAGVALGAISDSASVSRPRSPRARSPGRVLGLFIVPLQPRRPHPKP